MKKKKSTYQEMKEMLKRIESQDEMIRKMKGEGEQYKDLTKGKKVTIYTNDKKAMKFWEE
ncbi:hypothetical protein [Metabacillus sp. cB07]|uniref:hypothetical protein n=1 Tax=Metabacillus sp. cB07 TaxID=2806989 RepID=UPI00193AB6BA|nr:hypothetical protein [Metabacillus sp. cB07]